MFRQIESGVVIFLSSLNLPNKTDTGPWFLFVHTRKQFTFKYVFRRVFHSGFQCKYMFYISFRVKLSGIKAMAQKHLKWSISQKVLLQVSELLTAHKDMDVAHRGQNFHNGIPFKMKENI